MSLVEREACPACGGAGGGPFGRAGSGWDIETYECPVCEGCGYVREATVAVAAPKPGLAKATPVRDVTEKKRISR